MASLGLASVVPGVTIVWDRQGVPDISAEVPTIAAALPDLDWLARCSIARRHPNASLELPHNPTPEAVAERMALWPHATDECRLVRALYTPTGRRSPWAVGAAAGRTIWDRAVRCRRQLDETGPEQAVADALDWPGAGRVPGEGLGWDGLRHMVGPGGSGGPMVRPAAELLALCGLMMVGPAVDPPEGTGRVTAPGWRLADHVAPKLVWSVPSTPVDRWQMEAYVGRDDGRPSWESVTIKPAVPVAAHGGWMSTRAR